MGAPRKKLVTIAELAEILGVTRERVRRVILSGKLTLAVATKPVKLDLEKAKKEWELSKTSTKPKNPSGLPKGNQTTVIDEPTNKTKIIEVPEPYKAPTFEGMTTADAERKDKVFKAKLSEIKFLEQSGELVRKEAVESEAFESGRKIRDAMLSIGPKHAHELAAETDPHTLENLLIKIITTTLAQGMRNEKPKSKK